MNEPYLTVTEVAGLLKVSRSHVYNLIKRRRLSATDVSTDDTRNATWRVDPQVLAEFLGKAPALAADGRARLTVVPSGEAA
jgi:hypothetical protein